MIVVFNLQKYILQLYTEFHRAFKMSQSIMMNADLLEEFTGKPVR